jgi:hypothetical protein
MLNSRVNLVFHFSHITQVSFSEFNIDGHYHTSPYLIQQRPKVPRPRLYFYSIILLLALCRRVSFFFSCLMSYTPLTAQFIKILELLSSPPTIRCLYLIQQPDLLLVFDAASFKPCNRCLYSKPAYFGLSVSLPPSRFGMLNHLSP